MKLQKGTLPSSHNREDFLCFGPIASKDGEFSGTKLADLGCFKQGNVDTNKYWHGAVVQSKKTKAWFFYSEWGRTGQSTNPQFQFVEGPTELSAQAAYEKQVHAKNDKRGEWVDKGSLGKILQPKPNKDCYLVRPQSTRNTGLPDAKNITSGNTVNISSNFDNESNQLLKDLRLGATDFARATIVGESLPTQEAIEKARLILDEATSLNNKNQKLIKNKILGGNQANNNDLVELSNMIYSTIQKIKNRGDDNWLLNPDNIQKWRDDLDVYENAIGGISNVVQHSSLPFELEYIPLANAKFIHNFMIKASRNKHTQYGKLKIKHLWKIKKDYNIFQQEQTKIKRTSYETPLHQLTREDLSFEEKPVYFDSGTFMLFHGTRSVNVGGILQTGLRLPKELSNVAINGAMYGPGIYTADDWKKSAGYCSISNSYWARGSGGINNRSAFMFICDVILGNPHIANSPKHFMSPPQGYHSIYAKGGSAVANNEFIIFKKQQINLRYLVEFEC